MQMCDFHSILLRSKTVRYDLFSIRQDTRDICGVVWGEWLRGSSHLSWKFDSEFLKVLGDGSKKVGLTLNSSNDIEKIIMGLIASRVVRSLGRFNVDIFDPDSIGAACERTCSNVV